jgi:hypothetical protein
MDEYVKIAGLVACGSVIIASISCVIITIYYDRKIKKILRKPNE